MMQQLYQRQAQEKAFVEEQLRSRGGAGVALAHSAGGLQGAHHTHAAGLAGPHHDVGVALALSAHQQVVNMRLKFLSSQIVWLFWC